MMWFGRDLKGYSWSFILSHLWYGFRCFFLFKRPVRFLLNYLGKKSQAGQVIELRHGLKIVLGDHPHDIITVFVVFAKREYGRIQPGSVVLDIGANIGVFALYAASQGAGRVLAFEPNQRSYDVLTTNIRINSLENVVTAFQSAVSADETPRVKFPIESSPYNAVLEDESDAAFQWVGNQTIHQVLARENIESVDLLKLDCEGAEHDILMRAEESDLTAVHAVRMEYHRGRVDELCSFLGMHGLHPILWRKDAGESGKLWFERSTEQKLSNCFNR